MNVYQFNGHLDGTILECIIPIYENDPAAHLKIQELPAILGLEDLPGTMLNTLINDIGTVANKDSTNNLSVDHLLYAIHYLWNIWGFRLNPQVITEQFEDLQTGLCPLGRSSRLLQIVLAMNFPEEDPSGTLG